MRNHFAAWIGIFYLTVDKLLHSTNHDVQTTHDSQWKLYVHNMQAEVIV